MSVRNKTVAPLQITAEQILSESLEASEKPLRVKDERILDATELAEYQGRKRTEYEEALRRKRTDFKQWARYALWEVSQQEFERARSIFERALVVDHSNVTTWIKYADMEMKNRNFNHARNVLERAVAILPRVDRLWLTYLRAQESLSDLDGTRSVFHNWLSWQPGVETWQKYIAFEKRQQNYEGVRQLYTSMTAEYPLPDLWDQWARFEESMGRLDNAREVFSQALDGIVRLKGTSAMPPALLVKWSQWELDQGEPDRARALLNFGLDNLTDGASKSSLIDAVSALERKYGSLESSGRAYLEKQRSQMESLLSKDPTFYDNWWSYLDILEQLGAPAESLIATFERAVSNTPEVQVKPAWRRYIYIWLRYAIYLEVTHEDWTGARAVLERLNTLIPHQKFTFAKVWKFHAMFEIRRGDIARARRIMGQSLGLSGKPKLYKDYIGIEKRLQDIGRCRILYEKYLARYPDHADAWAEYATFEMELQELDRARQIYEIALSMPQHNAGNANTTWLSYAEMEADLGMFDTARDIYRRMLSEYNLPENWIQFAMFEVSTGLDENDLLDEKALARARQVFDEAEREYRTSPAIRAQVYDARVEFEETYGTEESLNEVQARAPKEVPKRRRLEDGSYEQYSEIQFLDTTEKASKLLSNARNWAKTNEA